MARTRYKIIPGDTAPYFLTATIVNWLPLFNDPSIAEFIFDSLRFLQEHKRITIYAYVLMENHLHLVTSAENLGKEIGNFKSYTHIPHLKMHFWIIMILGKKGDFEVVPGCFLHKSLVMQSFQFQKLATCPIDSTAVTQAKQKR